MEQTVNLSVHAKIQKLNDSGPILALVSADISGVFAIRDIRVVEGRYGPFVAMPSRRMGEKYGDICFPCTKAFHQLFSDAVMAAYNAALADPTMLGADEESGEEAT